MKINDLFLSFQKKILKEKSEEELFSFYFGTNINLTTKYLNPLRTDNNPDCTFFYGEDELVFRDFARKEVYNIWRFVSEKYGISYNEAIKKIALDFNINLNLSSTDILLKNIKAKEVNEEIKKRLKKTNKLKDIVPHFCNYDFEFLNYFSSFDYFVDNQLLKKYRIYPIKSADLIFEENSFNIKAVSIGACYGIDKTLKEKQVYFPFNEKRHKFRQIIKQGIVGLEFLKKNQEYVILTKSYKDFFILQICGFNACCILSEEYSLSAFDILELKKYGKKIITLFDNDETGIKRSKNLADKFKTISLFLELNDSYQHYKELGRDSLINFITNKLKEYGIFINVHVNVE